MFVPTKIISLDWLREDLRFCS